VFHWGGLISVGPYNILNGSGFLRLVLDHYLGRRVVPLSVSEDAAPSYRAETVAVLLTGGPSPAVIVSSFSPRAEPKTRPVSVGLPPGVFAATAGLRVVRFKAGQDVISRIRRDLAAERNLRPEFDACALCEASPMAMAADNVRARQMLDRNWPGYEDIIRDGLRWKSLAADVTVSGGKLTAQLAADEIIVLEFQ
jgi:hypothetical protein